MTKTWVQLGKSVFIAEEVTKIREGTDFHLGQPVVCVWFNLGANSIKVPLMAADQAGRGLAAVLKSKRGQFVSHNDFLDAGEKYDVA